MSLQFIRCIAVVSQKLYFGGFTYVANRLGQIRDMFPKNIGFIAPRMKTEATLLGLTIPAEIVFSIDYFAMLPINNSILKDLCHLFWRQIFSS